MCRQVGIFHALIAAHVGLSNHRTPLFLVVFERFQYPFHD